MAQQRFFDHWSEFFKESALQRQWAAAFVAGLITLLPLILGVDLYVDDLERAMDRRLS